MNFNKPFIQFIFIALIKIFFLSFYIYSSNEGNSINIVHYAGDADSYIEPLDNLMNHGIYIYSNPGGEPAKAGRMPHYGIIYFIFHLLFSRDMSLLLLVILQIILDIISTYCLYKIILLLTKQHNKVFLIFLILSAACLYLSWWDVYIAPESISYSMLIFFTYFYILYQRKRKRKELFLSGFFLGIAVALKPYYGMFMFLICVEIVLYYFKNKFFFSRFKALFIDQILIVSTIFVLLTPWTIRNYYALNRFVPLQQDLYSGFNYDEVDLTLRDYIASWGGNFIFWDKRSAGCYFNYNLHCLPCEFEMPEYAYCSCYGKKETIILKNDIINYQKNVVEGKRNNIVKMALARRMQGYIDCFANEKPLFYYLWGPLLRIKNSFINSGSFYLPVPEKPVFIKAIFLAIKLFQSSLYYIILFIGFIGFFYLFKKYRELWFFAAIILYLILLFPIYLKASEWRYFNPVIIYFTVYSALYFSNISLGKYINPLLKRSKNNT